MKNWGNFFSCWLKRLACDRMCLLIWNARREILWCELGMTHVSLNLFSGHETKKFLFPFLFSTRFTFRVLFFSVCWFNKLDKQNKNVAIFAPQKVDSLFKSSIFNSSLHTENIHLDFQLRNLFSLLFSSLCVILEGSWRQH